MSVKTKKWCYSLAIAGAFVMVAGSCKKDNLQLATVDTVLSPAIKGTAVEQNSVVSVSGNITDIGGAPVFETGVVYTVVALNSTSQNSANPTVASEVPTIDKHTQKVASSKVEGKQFITHISTQTPGYYIVRTYAANRHGVAYGNIENFVVTGGNSSSGSSSVDLKVIKQLQTDVEALKQKISDLTNDLKNKISGADLQALSNTVANLAKSDDEKINALRDILQPLIDAKASLQQLKDQEAALKALIDGKASVQDLTDAKAALQALIDQKASKQDLTDAKAALQVLIDGKATPQDIATAKSDLQGLIDQKASKQELTDAKAALQAIIDGKATPQDIVTAKSELQGLIDQKASKQDLTDAKVALQALIDVKANQTDLDDAKKRLSNLEEIVLNMNPISGVEVTELGGEKATITISLIHASSDPTKKPFSGIEKLEYVCFPFNQAIPSERKPIAFDVSSYASNTVTAKIPLELSNLSSPLLYKITVYATMTGGKKEFYSRTVLQAK